MPMVLAAAADDYMERGIDLNEQLILNKPATFFFRMNGDAMIEDGIFSGDILIVDRSIKPLSGQTDCCRARRRITGAAGYKKISTVLKWSPPTKKWAAYSFLHSTTAAMCGAL
jgi:hypothetical protein